MRYLPTALGTALAIAVGAAAVVFGEADDSPGLQLIGALLALSGLALGVRSAQRIRQQRR